MVLVNTTGRVLVYGAAGHTGAFVVGELLARGLTPVLAGRSAERLASVGPRHRELERRIAAVDDPGALRRALAGVDVVVNCAGPFLDTGLPLARAAVAAGAHYLDVTAEQPSVAQLYRELDRPARDGDVSVIPAMAFYGGLADLVVTAALDGDVRADEVEVAIGLDHWWPTTGTRVTGARNTATRQVIRDGRLVPLTEPGARTWSYPPPLGEQDVVELPFSETCTIGRHLDVGDLYSYLNTAPLQELRDGGTPPPTSADERGRSSQLFAGDVVVRRGADVRSLGVSGRDIYAVSAPIVCEGVVRLLDGRHHGAGALAPGQAFDARDVLHALVRDVDGFSIRDPAGLGQVR